MAAESRAPDPHKSTQIAVVGKKGSGKTELGFHIWDSYPFDRVAIDPPGDLVMPEDAVELESPVPTRWPGTTAERIRGEEHRRARSTLHYVPDFTDKGYLEEMDRVIGLAYGHGHTCVLADEAHELAPANKTPPHTRRALRQGRHRALSLIFMTPRPLTVDPLVLAQSDFVYVFKLPNPNDRKRVAESIGWDPKDFDQAVHDLGEYEYLRYDSAKDDLAHFPPLPPERLRHHSSH